MIAIIKDGGVVDGYNPHGRTVCRLDGLNGRDEGLDASLWEVKTSNWDAYK